MNHFEEFVEKAGIVEKLVEEPPVVVVAIDSVAGTLGPCALDLSFLRFFDATSLLSAGFPELSGTSSVLFTALGFLVTSTNAGSSVTASVREFHQTCCAA